jgi:ribosomal protein S18 acetylase RimI-like enzyme
LTSDIAAAFIRNFKPDREASWIAERGAQILGAVFVVEKEPGIAQLRMLYVEPEARGAGLGRRLVDECIAFARAKDYRRLELWTNDILVAARRIYETADFTLVSEEKHHSFGRDLTGQTWALELEPAPAPVKSLG